MLQRAHPPIHLIKALRHCVSWGFVVFGLLMSGLASAQPSVDWATRWGIPGTMSAGRDAAQATDGSLYVIGTSDTYPEWGPTTTSLLHLSLNGDTLWTRTYGNRYGLSFTSMALSPYGEIVLAGNAEVSDTVGGFALMKLSAEGDSVWTRLYHVGNSHGIAVKSLPDGGFVACGNMRPDTGHALGVLLIFRTDSAGNERWFTTIDRGTITSFSGGDVTLMPDGGFAAVSFCTGYPVPLGSLFVRLGAFGDTLWTRAFDGDSGRDFPYSIFPTPDGGTITAGYTLIGDPGGAYRYAGTVSKVGPAGDLEWRREYADGDWSGFCDISPAIGGGYIACGYLQPPDLPHIITYLVKLTENGDTVWTTYYWTSGQSYAQSLVRLQDGSYLTAGSEQPFPLGEEQILTIHFGAENAVSPFILPPSSFILSCFPNPFNPTTTISFSLPHSAKVEVNIFDITGRLVETLADQRFEAGAHSLIFDGSSLPSGIYFARLRAGEFVKTQKMVLLK